MPKPSQKPQTEANMLDLVDPGDPILDRKAAAVAPKNISSDLIQRVTHRMLALAAGKAHNTEDTRQMVGLAAPQIGVSRRIIVVDTTATGKQQEQTLEVFYDPLIVEFSPEMEDGREGCWSTGRVCGNVLRHSWIVVEAYDAHGELVRRRFTGFVARIVQHEIDHLDGLRFPDRISVEEPERLHWVEPAEFDDYREHWRTWPVLCARATWERVRKGVKA